MARNAGYRVEILGDRIEGEAQAVAQTHAEHALCTPPGTLLLSGGELTVTHSGSGQGGPNTEYALALASALQGQANIYAIACDTDGTDGSGGHAGAIITPDTLQRARQLALNPEALLQCHDSYHFFKPLDDLVISGPTYTNINDFRAILIDSPQ